MAKWANMFAYVITNDCLNFQTTVPTDIKLNVRMFKQTDVLAFARM